MQRETLSVLIFKLLQKHEGINSPEQSVSHQLLSPEFNVRFVFEAKLTGKKMR